MLTQPLYSQPLPFKCALLNSLKPNNEQPNEHKETKARQNEKTTESVENISAMKQIQSIKWRPRHFVSGSLGKVASAVQASRE